jgi:hypothetical protein
MSDKTDRPSSRRPEDRLESTVEMDVRDHMKRAAATSAPPTLMSAAIGLQPLKSVRVAVRPGTGRQLDVTRLADDEPVPAGAQEALIIALTPR